MKFYCSKFYSTKQFEQANTNEINDEHLRRSLFLNTPNQYPILSFHLSFKFVDLPIICCYGNDIL